MSFQSEDEYLDNISAEAEANAEDEYLNSISAEAEAHDVEAGYIVYSKFKKGDRVVLIGNDVLRDVPPGTEGTVELTGNYCYGVRFDGATCSYIIREYELDYALPF